MVSSFLSDKNKTLKRVPLPASILNLITEYILSGELKPGDKLPIETELAEHLGVGRNSVREAMSVLSTLGVIEIKRGKGTYIKETMSSSILEPLILSLAFEQGGGEEILELRLGIEKMALDLVLKKHNEDDLQRLSDVNDQIRDLIEQEQYDLKKLLDLDIKFHLTIYSLTRNPFVEKIARTIHRLFLASMEKVQRIDPPKQTFLNTYANHLLIIDALKAKDPNLLERNIQASLSYWMDMVNADRQKAFKQDEIPM